MKVKLVSLSAILFTLVHFSLSDNQYCSIKSCKGHTMCNYKGLGPNCLYKKALPGGLTKKQQDEIVKKHNQFRQLVKEGRVQNKLSEAFPPADPSTMMPLKWDGELAKIAQTWASQCTFKHDECRDVGSDEKGSVGQNLGVIIGEEDEDFSELKVEDLVNDWFYEHDVLLAKEVYKYSGDGMIRIQGADPKDLQTGHFTQLIWGDTQKVGCGAQQYYDPETHGNTWLLVCNYNPAGNYLKRPIYKISDAKKKTR